MYFLQILEPPIQGILRSTNKIISCSVLMLVSSRSARGSYCKGAGNANYSMSCAHALNPCLRKDNRGGKVSNRMQLSGVLTFSTVSKIGLKRAHTAPTSAVPEKNTFQE